MPFLWTFPQFSPIDVPQQTVKVDERLTVRSGHYVMHREDRRIDFDQGVEAEYGVTKVQAEKLTVYLSEPGERSGLAKRAIAEGEVALIDPDGTIHASRLEFDWVTGIGLASSARIDVAGMAVRAESIDIHPGLWTLKNVFVKTCEEGEISFRIRSLKVVPGDRAIAESIQLNLYGAKIGPLPKYSLQMGEREDFFSVPSVSHSPRTGFRIGWKMGYELSPTTLVKADLDFFEKRKPQYSVQATHSFLNPKTVVSSPRSEHSRKQPYSFMDQFEIESPTKERERLAKRRLSISIGSAWNQGELIDGLGDVDRRYEIVGETSGVIGSWSGLSQVRFESLRNGNDPFLDRFMVVSTIAPPTMPISQSLEGFARIGVRAHWNEGAPFHGWVLPELGFAWRTNEDFQFAASYSELFPKGTPLYDFDQPRSRSTLNLRTDVRLGPTSIGILAKYGFRGVGWHDQEILVSQIAGCLEPFVLYKREQNSFAIGITLRPLKELEKVQNRIAKRKPGNQIGEPD